MKNKTKGTFEINNTRRKPQQQRSIDKLNRIFDAAALLLANPTEVKITTSMIAKQAEIAVGSVYQFYSNVEEIKEATLSRVLSQISVVYQRVVDKLPEDATLTTVTANLIDTTAEFYDKYPIIVKIITASTNNKEFQNAKEQINRDVVAMFAEIALRNNKNADPREIERWLRTVLQISEVMAFQMWTEKDAEKRQLVTDEWKALVGFYINLQDRENIETQAIQAQS